MVFFKHALKIFVIFFSLFIFSSFTRPDAFHEIQKNSLIRIGMTSEYKPLHFQSGGQWKGVEIEMVRSLGKFLGVKTEIHVMEFAALEEALQKGEIDIVLSGYSRSLKRAQKIWFSEPYLEITPAVMIDKRFLPRRTFGEDYEEKQYSTIWDLSEIGPMTLAVKEKSVYQQMVAQNFPNYKIHLVQSNREGLKALTGGKAQGYVHDSLYLTSLLRLDSTLAERYSLLKGGDFKEAICAGLPFGDVTLKIQIDTWIAELNRLGKIKHWLSLYMPE